MKKILILLSIIMIVALPLSAKTLSNVGTAGMQFLKLPIGARNIALSGAPVADVAGIEAIYLNPAGLSLGINDEVLFSSTQMVLDINHTFFGFAKMLDNAAFGFSGNILNYGDEEITTLDQPEGTGSTYSAYDIALAVSYAQNFTDRFSAGINVKYIYSTIWDNTASALGVDVGLQYDTGFKSLRIGMVMRNLGGDYQYWGQELRHTSDFDNGHEGTMGGVNYYLDNQENRLPTTVNLSLSYNFLDDDTNKLTGYFSTFDPQDGDVKLLFAGEYSFKDMLFIRGGYTYTNEDGYDKTFTAGAGFKLDFSGLVFNVGYGYTAMTDLDDTHNITVGIGF